MASKEMPIGVIVGSGFLVVLSLAILAGGGSDLGGAFMFFVLGMLGLGAFGIIAAFGRAAQGGAGSVEDDDTPKALRRKLEELDDLKDDGVLNVTEYRRKRKQLVDAWGMPDE